MESPTAKVGVSLAVIATAAVALWRRELAGQYQKRVTRLKLLLEVRESAYG
jgi:hypothetical protein